MKFRECIMKDSDLELYVDEVPKKAAIKLDLTLNPLGCPDRVLSSLNSITRANISSYNEPPELPELKQALARHSNVKENQIMLTCGSDQAIEIVLTHILESKEALGILVPTFPRFEIVARRLCDAKIKPFKSLKKLPTGCKAIFLCTPNNPTTEELNVSELKNIIKKNKETIFILDSAFSDFGQHNMSSLVSKFNNLIVIKSLSKSFGLSGLRVGWIETQKENISALREGVSPFRVPFICQKLALEALKDAGHVQKTIEFLSKEFRIIKREFGDNVVRKSDVPFFLFKIKDSKRAREWLFNKGVSVIDSTSFKGVENDFLRIMIGTKDQNRKFIKIMKQYPKILNKKRGD